MTQIITCAVVGAFTLGLSGQVQAQKDLKNLCDQLFPKQELERLGYSISYRSEGGIEFANVEDGLRNTRWSFTLGDVLEIQFTDLALTLFNPEFNELKQITKFDSLKSEMALTKASPYWDWDTELPHPSFDLFQSEEGYLACPYPLEADSLGDMHLGKGIFLKLQDLFSFNYVDNRGWYRSGTAAVWWFVSDYPDIETVTVDAENAMASQYELHLDSLDGTSGTAGLVFESNHLPLIGPSFVYHGFWPEGFGWGLLQGQKGWVYAGEVSDWRFEGEGVWQTSPALQGNGTRVDGLWKQDELFRGESSYYVDSRTVHRLDGEFYRLAQLDSLGISAVDRHAFFGMHYLFEPQHLKSGILWTYDEGELVIRHIREGSIQN